MAVMSRTTGALPVLCRHENASDAAVAFAHIKVVWAPINGAQPVLIV